jgi:hypothetical protein
MRDYRKQMDQIEYASLSYMMMETEPSFPNTVAYKKKDGGKVQILYQIKSLIGVQ